MLAGLLLVGAGVLKLGFLADFISHPVLAGFKAGTGLLIAVGQLGKVLGIEQTGDSFFEKLRSAIQNLDEISWPTAGLAAATIAGAVRSSSARRSLARSSRSARASRSAPWACSTSRSPARALQAPLAGRARLGLIGPLLPAAAGIALMSFVESIAAGRAIAHKGEREPDADRELLALGAANLAGGLFRSLPAGGGLSQTAVNDPAETKRAGLVTAVVTALTLHRRRDLRPRRRGRRALPVRLVHEGRLPYRLQLWLGHRRQEIVSERPVPRAGTCSRPSSRRRATTRTRSRRARS